MSTACPLHKVFKIGKKVQNFNQETKRSLLGKIRGVDKYECSINVQIVEVFDRFCSSNDPPTSSSSPFYLEVEKGLVLRSLMAAFWLRNRPSQSELWRGVKEIDPHQSCQKKKKVKNRHKTFYIFSTKSDNAPAKSLLLRSKTFILHGMINTAASRGPWWALTLKLSQEKKHFLASFSSVYSHIIFFCTISLDITELRLFISLHLPSNKNSNLTVHNQISLFFFCFADWCFGVSSVAFSTFSPGPCLVPFVSVSGKCVWLSETIGFGSLRRALQSTADCKLYFSTELLGHYYGAWSEQCLLVFAGRQL